MSFWPQPRVLVPIFNPSNYTFSSLGLTEAQADLVYVRLSAPSQSITGSLGVSNLLTAGTFSASSNTGGAPSYSFNGHSDSGFTCITAAPNEARIEHYIDGVNRFQYDKSNFIVNLTFRANIQRFATVDAGMKFENVTTGSLFFGAETPLLFRSTEIELTKPLILPASTATTNNDAPYTIFFQNENTPPNSGQLFGIKARVPSIDFPSLAFFLNNNEVMGFDRSNMIVKGTFRANTQRFENADAGMRFANNTGRLYYGATENVVWDTVNTTVKTPLLADTVRAESADIGYRFAGVLSGRNTLGHYYSAAASPNFNVYSLLIAEDRFEVMNPLIVSIPAKISNFNISGRIAGSPITIIRRLTPSASITQSGNSGGSVTLTFGVTLPNTNYNVFTEIVQTSGDGHITTTTGTKTTTSVVINYWNSGSGGSSVSFRIEGMVYGY